MLSKKEKLEKIKKLITDVISGDLRADKALNAWADIDQDDNWLKDCWFHLTFYAHDEDIRAKDKEYAEYQVRLLHEDLREIQRLIDSQ